MSLVRSTQLFLDSSFPLVVDAVSERALFQPNMHRHEYFEMLFVVSGALVNRFRHEEVRMKTGDFMIMKPYVLHVLENAGKGRRPSAYCCSFLPEIIDGTIHSLEEVQHSESPNGYFFKSFQALADDEIPAVRFNLAGSRRKDAADLFSRLKHLTAEKAAQPKAWARCTFLQLLAEIADGLPRETGTASTLPASNHSVAATRYQRGIHKALNHIHDHFTEPLKLADMAALSGASVTYFCLLFKHETGMRFRQYVNSLRIERACVLLRTTSDNAMDICFQVGFNDYSHFSRQFKRLTGVTAKVYRNQPHAPTGTATGRGTLRD